MACEMGLQGKALQVVYTTYAVIWESGFHVG